jgi:hypothetical protein
LLYINVLAKTIFLGLGSHGAAIRFPEVPFVFYSRKITPEDVIRVSRAGAADLIRKGTLKAEELLLRLAAAQKIHHSDDAQSIRARGLNVNATIVRGE